MINLRRHGADRIGDLIALEEAGERGLGRKPIGVGEYILETSMMMAVRVMYRTKTSRSGCVLLQVHDASRECRFLVRVELRSDAKTVRGPNGKYSDPLVYVPRDPADSRVHLLHLILKSSQRFGVGRCSLTSRSI